MGSEMPQEGMEQQPQPMGGMQPPQQPMGMPQ
jgi:hypothetical protein